MLALFIMSFFIWVLILPWFIVGAISFQRRNDREEIRRKLAMGLDEDQTTDRPHRKPSLHSRLQSGELQSRLYSLTTCQ